MTALKTKKQTILEELQKIKGVGDFTLVAETNEAALKKSRVTKVATPSHLATITKIKLAIVSMGNSYQESVNKRLEEEGKDANFQAKKTYCLPLTQIEGGVVGFAKSILKKVGFKVPEKFSKIIYKHGEREQYYLRVYPNLATKYEVKNFYFDANGNALTKDEYEKIKEEYLKLDEKIGKGENNAEKFIDCIDNSQGGLENKVIVNNYKIENVLYLGDERVTVINELDEETLALVA